MQKSKIFRIMGFIFLGLFLLGLLIVFQGESLVFLFYIVTEEILQVNPYDVLPIILYDIGPMIVVGVFVVGVVVFFIKVNRKNK